MSYATALHSPLKLSKASTAIDGFSGSLKAILSIDAGSTSGTQGYHHATPPAAKITTTAAAMAGIRLRFATDGFPPAGTET